MSLNIQIVFTFPQWYQVLVYSNHHANKSHTVVLNDVLGFPLPPAFFPLIISALKLLFIRPVASPTFSAGTVQRASVSCLRDSSTPRFPQNRPGGLISCNFDFVFFFFLRGWDGGGGAA